MLLKKSLLKKSLKLSWLNLVIAALYAGTGLLGLLLPTGSQYATAIWLPSGIALGALLVWRATVLPGIFIGSFTANAFITLYHHLPHQLTTLNSLIVISFIIATGATLQALGGAFLLKKALGRNNLLNQPNAILAFTLISGPIACLINASISNTALLLLNIITAENFLSSWLTWYAGDTMGALIATPMFLILFAKPRALWHARVMPIFLPLSITFVVVVMIYVSAKLNFGFTRQINLALSTGYLFCVFINIVLFIIQGQRNLMQFKMTEILRSAGEGIFGVNLQGKISFVNPAAEKMWGFKEQELLGKHYHDVFHTDALPLTSSPIYKSMHNNISFHKLSEILTRKNNSIAWIDYTCTPLKIENKTKGAVVVFKDITERRDSEIRLKKLAHYDSLTDLPNRASFLETLANYIDSMASSRLNLVVCFIDLDNFKQINDTLGHGMGDATLITVAQIVKSHLSETDYFARLGGDEFALILTEFNSEEDIKDKLDSIFAHINTPVMINASEIRLSLSIGVALFPNAGITPEELIKSADIAMYRAKESGKNQYAFFDEVVSRELARMRYLDLELQQVLTKNELSLQYQFFVNSHTKKVSGIEALLRWQHPLLSQISPSEFIGLAEKNGSIYAIGEWVINKACEEHQQITAALKIPLMLSINVSILQLSDLKFYQHLKKIMRAYKLTNYLYLEITETALMKEPSKTIELMNKIRTLGINFALDDFGTGYSSMQYLKNLPIAKIKIDACFIRDITINKYDPMIVKAIIQLANSLNIPVIAEGVELLEQVTILEKMGCQYIQGYYFSHPLARKELITTIFQYNKRVSAAEKVSHPI